MQHRVFFYELKWTFFSVKSDISKRVKSDVFKMHEIVTNTHTRVSYTLPVYM